MRADCRCKRIQDRSNQAGIRLVLTYAVLCGIYKPRAERSQRSFQPCHYHRRAAFTEISSHTLFIIGTPILVVNIYSAISHHNVPLLRLVTIFVSCIVALIVGIHYEHQNSKRDAGSNDETQGVTAAINHVYEQGRLYPFSWFTVVQFLYIGRATLSKSLAYGEGREF